MFFKKQPTHRLDRFLNPPSSAEREAEEIARQEREAAHMAKVQEARAKMLALGVKEIQPLIKVSRARRKNIAANSANLVAQTLGENAAA